MKVLVCLLAACLLAVSGNSAENGVVPKARDGRSLNLGFEEGNLKDWTADGAAFERQPIRGDVVSKRRGDMKSAHEGEYWVGSFEVAGDAPRGVLTSVAFPVTHPWASFRVAGGNNEDTRVELVLSGSKEIIFKIHGEETEILRPVLVDLSKYQGKDIFIRVIDQSAGPWGHINFDDFRFFAGKPELKDAIDPLKVAADAPPPVDNVKFAGLSPEEAAAAASVPEGFSMHLFAGEPDVKQPIAIALDDRGRLWVAEAYTYPRRAPEGQGKDRILILEDTNGDHKFDKRTVFIEKLNLVSGLELGFGGVWVGAAPNLLFIPDRDGDDRPDGEPEIVLDGWGYEDTHETLNTFIWGPDGWLYGCHGVFTRSNVGKPGASDAERTRLNGAIWRYQPVHKKFEIFSEGTSNPWGIDYDAKGQMFIEACVIPHLFHMIQGARYQRQAGQHFNPYIYDDIKQVGDHVHYAGNKGPHAANNRSDAAGGGHAHAGLMIYQGNSFPEKYHNKIFMNNIHGQRLNMDIPERRGSGFVGKHGPDFVNFNDRWSQVLNMIYDQDGSVYIVDWYDQNQCHHGNESGHDRSNGRIFKLVYNDQKVTPIDLKKKSNHDLFNMVASSKNQFYARHARRILQERGANEEMRVLLTGALSVSGDGTLNPGVLHYVWALHSIGAFTEEIAFQMMKNEDEYVRAWCIQLLCETKEPSDGALDEFAELAAKDPSPVVRLYLASAMQRTSPQRRWEVLTNLLKHEEDATDHNLPLVYWYAAEGSVAADPKRGAKLLREAKIPLVRQFIARRIASTSKAVASR